MSHQSVSISSLKTGEQAIVLSFGCGRMVQNRLASLGFTPGAEVNVTQNYRFGPLIVTVRGARVALGRGEAAQIFVQRRSA